MTEDTGALTPILVAIDGPAGSGKSSVSRAVADRLGFGILDTGAAYRALAWAACETNVDLDSPDAVLALMDSWSFRSTLVGEQLVGVVLSDGEKYYTYDVTEEIRTPEISGQVSRISKHAEVRVRLNEMFREIVSQSGLLGVVIEGRDITTVVAPDAPVRIIMTASPDVRAMRRAGELAGVPHEQVLADINARDAKDALVVDFVNPAPGVKLIDTSDMNFDQSIQAVIDTVEAVRTAKSATEY